MATSRIYLMMDILIIGATSFVGRRFVKKLIEQPAYHSLTVHCTARSAHRMRDILGPLPPHFSSSELNLKDREAVFAAVKEARIVVNFAGPFGPLAPVVVEACVAENAHYLDISGEFDFARDMIREHHTKAKQNGVCIVPAAGFDSVPSDLMAWTAAHDLLKATGEQCASLDLVVRAEGGFNGGTVTTMMATGPDLTKDDLSDAHFLILDQPARVESKDHLRFVPELKQWTAPFFMEAINSKVVYRTAAEISTSPFAKDFTYRENHVVGKTKIPHVALLLVEGVLVRMLRSSLGRKTLKRLLPKPGEGPSEKKIQNGFYSATAVARNSKGHRMAKLSAKGDPSNESTVNLLLACMDALLTGKSSPGVLTPMMAFGPALLDHVTNHGAVFKRYDASESLPALEASPARS